MSDGRALSAYATNDVLAMTPAQRVVFLYTQLVASLMRAQRCLATGDIEDRSTSLCRAQIIVHELISALDRDAGGDLARQLADLYGYFATEIIAVDAQKDAVRLERLVTMVTPLLSAWERAAQEVDGGQRGVASA